MHNFTIVTEDGNCYPIRPSPSLIQEQGHDQTFLAAWNESIISRPCWLLGNPKCRKAEFAYLAGDGIFGAKFPEAFTSNKKNDNSWLGASETLKAVHIAVTL